MSSVSVSCFLFGPFLATDMSISSIASIRSKRMQATIAEDPMEMRIIEKMKSSGGRMKKKAFLNAFREWTRNDRDKERFRSLIKKLITRADDAIEGQVLVLKSFYS